MHTFSDIPSFSKISNPNIRTTKLVNSVFYHPCSSRLASGIHFIFLTDLSLSRMLSLTCILLHVEENFFQFMVFTFLENALNLCIFTHAPVPHSKLQREFFKNLFPPRRKRWKKLWFALSKFNQKIWRWLGTFFFYFISFFYIFSDFSKCDGFTILEIISVK